MHIGKIHAFYCRSGQVSSLRVGVYVASMTGLAEICAEEIAAALSAVGIEPLTRLMDGLSAEALADCDVVVIVSSTYGHGDIPDNGRAFFAALQDSACLSGKRFAVFGLGDRTYSDTFCRAGELWDKLLEEKGAARLTPLERHDASAGTLAEDRASEWARGWVSSLARDA